MFKPTIALLLDYGLGQMWDTGATGYLQASEEVAKTWFRVANISCMLGFISDAISDDRKLQSITEIKPLDTCDYDFECKATAPEVKMPEAHRPMLLFAQLLETESTACVAIAARTDLAGINLPEHVKCDGIAAKLQLLTDQGPRIMVHKCIDQFMQPSNGGMQQQQDQQQYQQQDLSLRNLMLRSSMMLLKLASLIVNVQSSSSIYLSQTINSVITLLTRALHQATVSSSDNQEHQMAVHAVKLVMTMLKYHVKQGCNKATTAALLEFLECVLEGEPDGTLQPLLAHLLASGTALCAPNIICMQTKTHHLSDSASDLLGFPLPAEYLLMKGAKHGHKQRGNVS